MAQTPSKSEAKKKNNSSLAGFPAYWRGGRAAKAKGQRAISRRPPPLRMLPSAGKVHCVRVSTFFCDAHLSSLFGFWFERFNGLGAKRFAERAPRVVQTSVFKHLRSSALCGLLPAWRYVLAFPLVSRALRLPFALGAARLFLFVGARV